MTWSDLVFLLPEIVSAIGASILLLLPVMGLKISDRQAKWWMLVLLLLTAAAVIYASNAVVGMKATSTLRNSFALDGFAIFFKLLFIGIVAMITLLSSDFLGEERYSPWEYYSLISFALCGMLFMASGVHLISIYIGLELMSLSSYILAGYYKREAKSTEAAMKYFVLGTISSAILLYGMSLIYGITGSLQLTKIDAAFETMLSNDALMLGIIMIGAGLCFKIAAVPFHVWTPDVYEGAPTPIAAFLSTASKAAAFAIFARIFYMGLGDFYVDWGNILAVVSALSMIGGNLAAITQDNVKRMLAYSSIAHAGYGLLGIIALSELGMQSILVYMLVYALANLGIWATVLTLRRRTYAGESIADFEGLNRRSPFFALAMVVFLLSLGGIPPTAGFIGKYYLFAAAMRAGFGWLAIIAVLMSAVSMFYYLRLVVAMYLKEEGQGEFALTWPLKVTVSVCLVATLVLGIIPDRALKQIERSSKSIVASLNAP